MEELTARSEGASRQLLEVLLVGDMFDRHLKAVSALDLPQDQQSWTVSVEALRHMRGDSHLSPVVPVISGGHSVRRRPRNSIQNW